MNTKQRKTLENMMKIGPDPENTNLLKEALYTASETGIFEYGVSYEDAVKIWRLVQACDNCEPHWADATIKEIRM